MKAKILQNLMWILLCSITLFWSLFSYETFKIFAREDGWAENLTAIFYFIATLFFIIYLIKCHNKEQIYFLNFVGKYKFYILFLLMFLFIGGEEISWGQRIFNFSTPEDLLKINKQSEFNLHNIEFFDTFWGGQYRALSLMALTLGCLFPVLNLNKLINKFMRTINFPIINLSLIMLFFGTYIMGKIGSAILPDTQNITELRELHFSFGFFIFAFDELISIKSKVNLSNVKLRSVK
ncbi:MAG: hypothetical protein RBU23_05695 [Candidatus Auribacterota bacterium]|nr:hypothetical protein [Candidatus Auribacterota bacterium]